MSEVSEVWDFSEIQASHPARSSMLASTPGKLELAALLTHRLQEAMRCNSLRMGMDQSSTNDNELRITLQFLIGEELSDRFFNATTGYRAQFRRDWQCGFSYNKVVIERVRSVLQANLPDNSLGRRLSHTFDDIGPMQISREQVCASLHPDLSKLWFCAKLIHNDGVIEQLPTGLVGPRLRLPDGSSWAAIWSDDSSSWLEIKGAFLGSSGTYQLKDPIARAKRLAATGEA